MPLTVTILDDYQNVALSSADWSSIQDRVVVQAVREHISDQDALVRRLDDSAIVVAMRERTPFPAELFQRLPRLQLLVTTGARNASIDLEAAAASGVAVCATGGSYAAVPELTLGMMIALTRHFVEEDAAVRSGGWQHTIGSGLAGRTLGIVGLGRLGAPVARLAQAFGMDVLAWSRHLTAERAAEHGAQAVNKQELFERSDIVSIHIPLGRSSRGIIRTEELAALGPAGYLVNTSRGPIVDEGALVEALRDGTIAGAALDVYDIEPLPADHPLRSMPNTLLLPHIGYVTTDVYAGFFGDVVEDIAAFLAGSPIRTLTPAHE